MSDAAQRLRLLLSYIEGDVANTALIGDAVQAALDAGDLDTAAGLVEQLHKLAPDAAATLSLDAMLAMRERRFDRAAELYAELMYSDDGAALRFNRAWSLAMIGEKSEAAELLNDEAAIALPAAAALRLQLIHEAGAFEEAAEFAKAMLPRHGEDVGFAAAVSVLALDIEDIELATLSASRGGAHPDAVATRGMLFLNDADPERAMVEFDAAIATRRHHPRAWLGRGLAKLARHDGAGAAQDLDVGAEQFGDHIGSWLAAGWAYFTAGDMRAARARFEKALGIDDNFAESHGSLAVLDAVEGARDEAKRRVLVALRLDRQCFSAALAQSLLVDDDPTRARAIIDQALATPLNASGQTIGAYMAAMVPPTFH